MFQIKCSCVNWSFVVFIYLPTVSKTNIQTTRGQSEYREAVISFTESLLALLWRESCKNMSLQPSPQMSDRNSINHSMDFHAIWQWGIALQFIDTFQFCLKSHKRKESCTQWPTCVSACISLDIYCSKDNSNERCSRKWSTHHLTFSTSIFSQALLMIFGLMKHSAFGAVQTQSHSSIATNAALL